MGGRSLRVGVSGVVLILASVSAIATRVYGPYDWDWRYPCDGTTGWSSGEPLYVHWAGEGRIEREGDAYASGIWLEDVQGREIELFWSPRDDGLLVLCPRGGLAPESSYRWYVAEQAQSGNHISLPPHDQGGFFTLVTGTSHGAPPVETQEDCDAHELHTEAQLGHENHCDPCLSADTYREYGWDWDPVCPRPGDSGDPEDTAPTQDTGDTDDPADTGDTDDTGDTGDTDDTAPADTDDSATPWDTGEPIGDTGEPSDDTGDTAPDPVDTGDGGLP